MTASVDRILEGRELRGRNLPRLAGGLLALLFHAAIGFGALVFSVLGERPVEPLDYVAVRIVPVQAKGSRKPQAKPRPKREETPPNPAPPKEKVPEPERSPEPDPPPAPAPRSSPPTPAETETGDEQGDPTRAGAPDASPTGTSAFGAAETTFDNPDFAYDYYVDRMLAQIEASWLRPAVEAPIETLLHFRIAADGRVSELRVVRPSGDTAFDLAALRAVRNASPLPPLPRSYRKDSLGVNLLVR